MTDLSMLEQYYKLADQLIEKASKEDVAETARLLAVNLAHYKMKCGELPLDETLAMIDIDKPNAEQTNMIDIDKPNAEQTKMLVHGMETLVGVLGNIVMGIGQEKH